MLGNTIDERYRVLGVLGQGGMGSVYEAEHLGTGRRVAIKVINAEMAKKTEMVRRFQREARAAGSIETPHIVQVFDTGTDANSGVIYMVMELLRGEDLQHLLKRLGKLPPQLALRLVGQACIGLTKAHAAGVIHRDIKPANLFLSRHESGEVTVKVVDFGIAKIKVDVAAAEEAGLTRTGGMLGSPLYMSPEQATGRKTIDHRTDIWSLGVVLYQALTGRVPHPADVIGALVMAICTEPAPPIQDLAPWVPPQIALLVHRALARDQESRFPSVLAMLEAIRKVVPEGLTLHADALVPLTEAQQAYVAPRAVLRHELTRAPSASAPGLTSPPESASPGGEGTCTEEQYTDFKSECGPKGSCSKTCEKGACVEYTGMRLCAPPACTDTTHVADKVSCDGTEKECPFEQRAVFACDPYRCDLDHGACLDRCTQVNDCAPPFVCSLSGQCVPAPDVAQGTDPACAFAPASPAGGGHSGALATLALAALSAARRRRAASRSAP